MHARPTVARHLPQRKHLAIVAATSQRHLHHFDFVKMVKVVETGVLLKLIYWYYQLMPNQTEPAWTESRPLDKHKWHRNMYRHVHRHVRRYAYRHSHRYVHCHACRHMHRHVHRRVYMPVYGHTCRHAHRHMHRRTDVCIDVCIDMCIDMCEPDRSFRDREDFEMCQVC